MIKVTATTTLLLLCAAMGFAQTPQTFGAWSVYPLASHGGRVTTMLHATRWSELHLGHRYLGVHRRKVAALKSLVNFLCDKPMIQFCIRGFEPCRFLKNGGKSNGVVPRR
jgi:hypothetical protein